MQRGVISWSCRRCNNPAKRRVVVVIGSQRIGRLVSRFLTKSGFVWTAAKVCRRGAPSPRPCRRRRLRFLLITGETRGAGGGVDAAASAACPGGRESQGGSAERGGRWCRGRDVWASPGATGTHTLPLACRETDRPTEARRREMPGHVLTLNITSVHCLPLSTVDPFRFAARGSSRSSDPRKNAGICGDGGIYII